MDTERYPLVEVALQYSWGGIYPLREFSKTPYYGISPTEDATTDREQIQRWMEDPLVTGFGLNIRHPRLVVIDSDHVFKKGPLKPGPDGLAEFQHAVEGLGVTLPATLTVLSSSSGLHRYFLLPEGTIPEGRRLLGGNGWLPGVDIQTFGMNIILPGTEVDTVDGKRRYEIYSPLDTLPENLLAETPGSLADWLICWKGTKSLLEAGAPIASKSKRKGKGSDLTQVYSVPPSCESVDAVIERLLRHSPYFPNVWDATGTQRDGTASGDQYAIARCCTLFGCADDLATAIYQTYCLKHDVTFSPRRWQVTLKKARAQQKQGERKGSDPSQVYSVPPSILGTFLPMPIEPTPEQWDRFASFRLALESMSASRPTFDSKYQDDVSKGEWRRTRCYLLSITYFALRSGFDEHGVIWLQKEWLARYSPLHWLTAKRFSTFLKIAKHRLKAAKVQRKPYRPRASRGLLGRGKEVGDLLRQGCLPAKIATSLNISKDDVKKCRKRLRKYGIDASASPIQDGQQPETPLSTAPKSTTAESTFSDPLAALLHNLGQNESRKMIRRTAESIARKVREYGQAVGQTGALNEALIYKAWQNVTVKKSRPLAHYIRTRLAEIAAKQDPDVARLAEKLQQNCLPGMYRPFGRISSVQWTVFCLRHIRDWVGGEAMAHNTETVWNYIKEFGLRWGSEMCRREAVEKWLEEDPHYCAWVEFNCA